MNPTHRRVAPGKGFGTATRGTRGRALTVGAAVPSQGNAGAGQGGTGIAACRKHGEGASPNRKFSKP